MEIFGYCQSLEVETVTNKPHKDIKLQPLLTVVVCLRFGSRCLLQNDSLQLANNLS